MRKATLLLGSLLILSGCSLFHSNTSLMKAPSLPESQKELKQMIEQFVPDNAEWVSPLEDKHANKIIKEDLDGDQESEVIIFYRMPEITSQMEAVVLKKKDNKWTRMAKVNEIGRELEKVEFQDLNNDSMKEMLVGFSYSEASSDKALAAYDISTKETEKIFASSYSVFYARDFNHNGRVELLLSRLIRNEEHLVELYQFEEQKPELLDKLELDPYVFGAYNSVVGKVTPKREGVIIDSGLGAHSATSFIISVEDKKLKKVIPKNWKEEEIFKMSSANSRDSNQDGIVEFPLIKEGSTESLSYAEMPKITEYYQLNDQYEAELVGSYYQNFYYQFEMQLPDQWPPTEIRVSKNGRYIQFLSIEDKSVLFDILVVEQNKAVQPGWTVFYETTQYQYVSKMSPSKWKSFFHSLS